MQITNEQQQKQSKKESIYIISKFASDYFKNCLWDIKEGKTIGLGYFKERDIEEYIIRKFESKQFFKVTM